MVSYLKRITMSYEKQRNSLDELSNKYRGYNPQFIIKHLFLPKP